MVIMVNQMWLWILGDGECVALDDFFFSTITVLLGTVISSFPERWDKQDNYPDVLTDILELLRLEDRAVLESPGDLAAVIMRYCVTVFERARFKDEFKNLQFMDMFESDIGDVVCSLFGSSNLLLSQLKRQIKNRSVSRNSRSIPRRSVTSKVP